MAASLGNNLKLDLDMSVWFLTGGLVRKKEEEMQSYDSYKHLNGKERLVRPDQFTHLQAWSV